MCIIAIKPKNKEMFSDETLKIMFNNNPDGAGYMYYDKKSKKVVVKKGFMTLKALKKSLKSQDFKKTNLILHFRIGTSGENDKNNCHPYPVFEKNGLDLKTDLAVAHNGILSSYIPPKTSKVNDTQVFISKVLRPLNRDFLNDRNAVSLIQEIIGTNKLAFLDNTNTVHTIGNFINDNGYIYSNESYKPKKYTYSFTPTYLTSSYGWYDYKDDFDDYEYGTWNSDDDEYYCSLFGNKKHNDFIKKYGVAYWETNKFWDTEEDKLDKYFKSK